MTNWRVRLPANMRPSGPVSVAKNPMRKEPATLTMIVPQGKVSPKSRAATPEHQKRATPPMALPIATQI